MVACLPFGVSAGAGGRTPTASGPAGLLALVLWSCAPLLYCSAPCTLSLNMALFRVFRGFLEGFGVVLWVCLVLVLCVACVGFVRVWS